MYLGPPDPATGDSDPRQALSQPLRGPRRLQPRRDVGLNEVLGASPTADCGAENDDCHGQEERGCDMLQYYCFIRRCLKGK